MSAPKHAGRHRRQREARAVLVAFAAVVVVGGGAAALVGLHGLHHQTSAHGSVHTAAAHHAGTTAPATTRPAPPPLLIESTSPAGGAQDVAYAPTVTVTLSEPLAPGSPLPVLTPSIPGTWKAEPTDTLVFQPGAEYPPYTTVSLTIPGGAGGLRDTGGATLPSTVSRSFTVEGGSELRLQQMLAELGYLPLTFVRDAAAANSTGATGAGSQPGASTTAAVTPPAIDAEATTPGEVELAPEAGHFAWRWSNTPSYLTNLWQPGEANVVTRGAVMAFEAQSGLTVDGLAGPEVWQALIAAVAGRHLDPAPYDWIDVSEASPETLTVWHDGEDLFTVYANTGIAEAPTAEGTYPVYARYLVTTMSGKNPNGTTYHDPGIPHVAYFNGGDAVHGFIRAGYGYPQSLGCVELTYADAAEVWPYDQLGTLVTVH